MLQHVVPFSISSLLLTGLAVPGGPSNQAGAHVTRSLLHVEACTNGRDAGEEAPGDQPPAVVGGGEVAPTPQKEISTCTL